jgi:hypothetical protein
MQGIGMAALLVICMAANIKLLSFLGKRIDNFALCSFEILFGLISIYFAFTFFKGNIFSVATTRDYIYFGISGFCSYGLAGYLAILHIRLAGEEKNAFLSPLITVMAVLGGVAILNESLNLQKAIGAVLVILSVFYYEWKTKAAAVYVPKKRELVLMTGLVLVIVTGIMLVRLHVTKTNLLAIQIVFIRYLGAMPVLIGFLVYALNKKGNVMVSYKWKDFNILLVSVLVSAIAINYLWIICNQILANLLLQTILSTLPLVVGLINLLGNKTYPSSVFIGSCLVAVVGILILFM